MGQSTLRPQAKDGRGLAPHAFRHLWFSKPSQYACLISHPVNLHFQINRRALFSTVRHRVELDCFVLMVCRAPQLFF